MGHSVATAYERGLAIFKNGDLIAVAELEFDLLITTDRNLRYQQRVPRERLAILVLSTTIWPKIRARLQDIADAVNAIQRGQYLEFTL